MPEIQSKKRFLEYCEEVSAKASVGMLWLCIFVVLSTPTKKAAYFIIECLGGLSDGWTAGRLGGFSFMFLCLAITFHLMDKQRLQR